MSAHQKAANQAATAQPAPTPKADTKGGNARRASLPHRAELEGAFGEDLSGIDVLVGVGEAAEQAGAKAFAVGDNTLVFADASPSKELVAHEVTHIVQQRQAGSSEGTSRKGDAAEEEAGRVAKAAARGESVDVAEGATGAVQGDWGDTGRAVGEWLLPGLGGDLGEALGDSLEADSPLEELAAFQARTFAPATPFMPPSGGMFDASFDAASLRLNVELRVAFDFVMGDIGAAGGLDGFRLEEFEWSPEEQEAWRNDYLSQVMAMWSGQHRIMSTKAGWEAVGVDVAIVVREDAADPHFRFQVGKFPPDAAMATSSVCEPGSHHDASIDPDMCYANPADEHGVRDPSGTAAMDSNDMRPEAKLDQSQPVVAIPFRSGSAELDGAGTAALQPVRDQLTADAAYRVTLYGRASNTHRRRVEHWDGVIENMDMARARSEAVRSELSGAGVTSDRLLVRNLGESGAGPGDEWCRVDAQLGLQGTQNPALHETGHMFGLGDEYTTGTNRDGSAMAPGYRQIMQDQLGTEVLSGSTESAMSLGSTILNHHYVTFLAALKSITGSQAWTV